MSAKTPWEKYQEDLQREDFNHDPAQALAVQHLQRLFDDFVAESNKESKHSLTQKIFFWKEQQKEPLQGLYFWGGVGRGKTYLVDTFYDCLPTEKKMRVHFHRFMHRVHDEMKALKGQKNPLPVIAEKFAQETDIICFDEFFVSDITDAMLLGTLMQELFKRGVTLVATSNIEPENLYRNGLQRARFLPAIDLILKYTEVVNVDSGIDYRLRTLEKADIFHAPSDEDAIHNLHTYFKQLTPESTTTTHGIEIEGRMIDTVMAGDGVVYFDFSHICETARSQVDYMELSRCYHTVLIQNVKQMGAINDDAARRFIALVDEFYERHVKLILSADVPLEALYTQGQLSFEFNRCISRLKEMQSHEYLAREHLP
ncbi:cell division protein ZapE [Algicola sagamiensis]|uniref:cell division protein ZapE n=1 Tax=Algicola sagamiensis TaxID=163869 RepID=UPI00037D7AE2|nr:cell division protein ZapE [Algicola sagamiensis]